MLLVLYYRSNNYNYYLLRMLRSVLLKTLRKCSIGNVLLNRN